MQFIPWLISDAEVSLWAAWKDGLPFHGPGGGRGRQEPLFTSPASVGITETFEASAPTGHGWTGAETPAGSVFQISLDFQDGAVSDAFGRVLAGMHAGGLRILTIVFEDLATGTWTKLTFFYVTPSTDALSESGQEIKRALTLKSTWKQEQVGLVAVPSLAPVMLGEVDWICGALRVTALTYDPSTETWLSLPRNDTGDGTRYVNLSPASGDDGADVSLAVYLPRVVPAPVTGEMLPTAAVEWQSTIVLILGGPESTMQHGLAMRSGHVLQTAGITEPLVMLPQDRMLDEPVVVFRYGRRVYATLGNGVLAVPRLLPNTAPPVVHDPAFRIAIPGPANPATGQSGLTLLPNGAWLDGTVVT
jgi:hypothetical protein